MTVRAYLPYYAVVGSAGVVAAILFGLSRALTKANWPTRERHAALEISALVLVCWLVTAIVLSQLGAYRGSTGLLPTLISAFPLVLIPVFLVPVSIVLHIASLTKLRRMRSHAHAPRGVAATVA